MTQSLSHTPTSTSALDGARIKTWVERYGTPMYVYELATIRANIAGLQAALPRSATLYYSVKANPHPAIIRELHAQGARAEVSSVGELRAALAAGVAAAECLYTGPGKTDTEIGFALAKGVRFFSVESLGELERLSRFKSPARVDVLLRVNGSRPRIRAGLTMTGIPSQFGIDLDYMVLHRGRVRASSTVQVVGTHWFNSTNISSTDDLARAFSTAIADAELLAQKGLPLRVLDLGGGFGDLLRLDAGGSSPTRLRDQIEASLDASFPHWRQGTPELLFESGRFLVASAGTLVLTVQEIKRSRDRTFVIVDGGVNVLGGMAALGRILPGTITVIGGGRSAKGQGVTVTGPLCTPLDVLARDVRLNRPDRGDLLQIPNVGAYAATASLIAFLSRDGPIELCVDEGRVVHESRLEVRRRALSRMAALSSTTLPRRDSRPAGVELRGPSLPPR